MREAAARLSTSIAHGAATFSLALVACGAVAQPPSDAAMSEALAERDRLIESLIARIEALERTVAELTTDTADSPGEAASPGPVAAVAEVEVADADALEIERREQEQLIRSAFQRTLVERGSLLLPPGTINVAPSASFLHTSTENIVIDGFTVFPVLVVGDIVSERVRRTLGIFDTTLRFGLPWKSQLDVRIPYSYQKRDSFSADNEENALSSSGIGDVELAFSRELFRSQGVWPDLVGSLRWRTRTGTSPFDVTDDELALGSGYNSLNLSLTGTKVADPLVYFGSVSYGYNDKHIETVGLFDPGDSFGFSLGMAIALNLSSTLAFSYDHQLVQKSKIDGAFIPGSDLTIGVFSVGGSYAISDELLMDLSLGIGITSDSPDLQLSASFPFRLRF